MSASFSISARISVVPTESFERDPFMRSTSALSMLMDSSSGKSESRMTIAVMSLVIEAIGNTWSVFLASNDSPVSWSSTSTAPERNATCTGLAEKCEGTAAVLCSSLAAQVGRFAAARQTNSVLMNDFICGKCDGAPLKYCFKNLI